MTARDASPTTGDARTVDAMQDTGADGQPCAGCGRRDAHAAGRCRPCLLEQGGWRQVAAGDGELGGWTLPMPDGADGTVVDFGTAWERYLEGVRRDPTATG